MATTYSSFTVDENWQKAWEHICHSRQKSPPNADIWHLRFHWPHTGDALLQQVLDGTYRLSPMLVMGEDAHPMWSAQDAMVLKFLALELAPVLPAHPRCAHAKGHGGVFGSVRAVAERLHQQTAAFLFRTDIQGFYENISKRSVVALAERNIQSPALRQLFMQYAHYSVESHGVIYTPAKGICRGCALSPMTAASLLWELDHYFHARCSDDFFYSRYMDDFLFLSTTRWPLRRAIAWLYARFADDGFRRHPEKTTTGRADKGFDWLGIWFSPKGYSIAPRARQQYQARREELRIRCQRRHLPDAVIQAKLDAYHDRWTIWCQALLKQTQFIRERCLA